MTHGCMAEPGIMGKRYAPRHVAVNRGNHEAFGMGVHGFTKEALAK